MTQSNELLADFVTPLARLDTSMRSVRKWASQAFASCKSTVTQQFAHTYGRCICTCVCKPVAPFTPKRAATRLEGSCVNASDRDRCPDLNYLCPCLPCMCPRGHCRHNHSDHAVLCLPAQHHKTLSAPFPRCTCHATCRWQYAMCLWPLPKAERALAHQLASLPRSLLHLLDILSAPHSGCACGLSQRPRVRVHRGLRGACHAR